ncbi:MAG: US12 family protein [Clostridia bacterium]|nr:US12 family protein [Clostridia bacterium]
MALGNSKAILTERQFLREGEVEISERAFNLIIGAMLMWGFLLNFATVALFGNQAAQMVRSMNPLIFLVIYIALVLIGNFMIVKGGALMSFAGYTLIAAPIGILLCVSLQGVPASVIESAVLITAIVTLSFMIAATVFPGFFLSLGRVLFFSLIFTIVGSLLSSLLFRGAGHKLYTWLGAGIFSLYIGYDWARANTCARTVDNAIDLSASLYLDIINLFLRIVEIMNNNRK